MKLILSFLLLTFSFSSFSATLIGLVDIQKIITTIKEGKGVQKTLEKSFNDKKALLKKDEDKIKKAQEDYKKQSMVLAEAARANKEREMQEMMMKLQNKTMEYQREIQKMEQDMKKPILEKLRPIIDEVSQANKVDMTFELSAAPIVYAANKKDLTEEVIKAYDKKHPK
ncbi:MAG: OmpH family outer membrane protein [Bacteriovoracaceae bacterium]|nr:OmpH family outer membrane protein [Bacteriovoracaceae bacterium]